MKKPFEESIPSVRKLLSRIEDLEVAKTSMSLLIASKEDRVRWACTWVTPVESLIVEIERTYDLEEFAEQTWLGAGPSSFIRTDEEKQRGMSVLATTILTLSFSSLEWFDPFLSVPADFDPERCILYTHQMPTLTMGLRMYDRASTTPDPEGLTITQVANGLGINKGKVTRLVDRGHLRDNGKTGTPRRINPASVLEYCKREGIAYNDT